MSLEKILVDDFEFFVSKDDELGIALDIDEGMIFSADLMYDGRNCAILTRNNKKAFLLTNILLEIRERLNKAEKVLVIERVGPKKEIANAYGVSVRHVPEIPYPDNFVSEVERSINELKEELGEDEFNELMKSLADEYKKTAKK